MLIVLTGQRTCSIHPCPLADVVKEFTDRSVPHRSKQPSARMILRHLYCGIQTILPVAAVGSSFVNCGSIRPRRCQNAERSRWPRKRNVFVNVPARFRRHRSSVTVYTENSLLETRRTVEANYGSMPVRLLRSFAISSVLLPFSTAVSFVRTRLRPSSRTETRR